MDATDAMNVDAMDTINVNAINVDTIDAMNVDACKVSLSKKKRSLASNQNYTRLHNSHITFLRKSTHS